jgi:hypothetical protein
MHIIARQKPNKLEPVSPRNTLRFLPKYPRLYARNPIMAPIKIRDPE